MTMFIHFFCLCPLSLTIKLNFNISKVAYCFFAQFTPFPKVSDNNILGLNHQLIELRDKEVTK